jgi:hypothetical protein
MLKYADVLFTGFTRVTCAGSDVLGPLGSFDLAFGFEARDALVVRVVCHAARMSVFVLLY